MMHKILIVEDDKNILTGLVDNLEMEGYRTVIAKDGEEGLRQAKEKLPDLIILDVMLPKLKGFDVCKRLKKDGINIPIIILSARGAEADKVLGLELGADDYVTKPFSPRELIVRVKAVLRRTSAAAKVEDVYEFDGIRIDFKKFQVFKKNFLPPLSYPKSFIGNPELKPSLDTRFRGYDKGGGNDNVKTNLDSNNERSDLKEIKLTAAEFKILKLLIANIGEPVSRHKILAEIWAEDVTSRTVDTHIWSLREKLEKDPANPKHIITVHRIGYKFSGRL